MNSLHGFLRIVWNLPIQFDVQPLLFRITDENILLKQVSTDSGLQVARATGYIFHAGASYIQHYCSRISFFTYESFKIFLLAPRLLYILLIKILEIVV